MIKLNVLCLILCMILILVSCQENAEVIEPENYGITNQVILDNLEHGIHTPSGLVAGEGLESVLRHCVSCHSSKLITQNRATKEGWTSMIQWMYKTQNLPQLGDQEGVIVSYLSKYYAPVESGRRQELVVEEWYELD